MRALSNLRISLLAAAAATALGSPAVAQPSAPAPAAQNQPEDEVVIVTARRRAEDVQSVPVAVSAIPLADNDAAANGDDSGDEPRRGWWQRTFG